ncbi:hypothetical protein BC941DRAFT_3210 [Chlamydoabsidia padenii]|nr:hypothetical protein BC941DRAFT_3210 [Chlamydoabsidia padenii]
MYKDMNTQNLPRQKQQHQSIPLRYQYTKEQLLALQTSPLVSKPASLPPLSSWLNRDSSLSNCSGQHNQTAMGAHDRYIQPKASISTPSRSSNYSKMMETTGQYWNHRQNQPKGIQL